MDFASILGLIGAAAVIGVGVLVSTGGNLLPYLDVPSLLIVVLGSWFVNMICHPLEMTTRELPRACKYVFQSPSFDPTDTIRHIVEITQKARREGLLALEIEAVHIENPFLKKGVHLIVDGNDPELVRDILETETHYAEERRKSVIGYFYMWGSLAPAFGLIGTLIGMVGMLFSLENPSSIGPGMAAALLSALYGALLANVFLNPFAAKLNGINSAEVLLQEIILEGILAMQAGENPHTIEEKLAAFLPTKSRKRSGALRFKEEN